jgi:hypothetical protein
MIIRNSHATSLNRCLPESENGNGNLKLNHRITLSARVSTLGGYRETDLLGSFKIDNEFEGLRLLHRQLGWLCSFKNFVDIGAGAAKQLDNIGTVTHYAAGLYIFSLAVRCRQPALYCQLCKFASARVENGTIQHENCISTVSHCLTKCWFNIYRTSDFNVAKVNAQGCSSSLCFF